MRLLETDVAPMDWFTAPVPTKPEEGIAAPVDNLSVELLTKPDDAVLTGNAAPVDILSVELAKPDAGNVED